MQNHELEGGLPNSLIVFFFKRGQEEESQGIAKKQKQMEILMYRKILEKLRTCVT